MIVACCPPFQKRRNGRHVQKVSSRWNVRKNNLIVRASEKWNKLLHSNCTHWISFIQLELWWASVGDALESSNDTNFSFRSLHFCNSVKIYSILLCLAFSALPGRQETGLDKLILLYWKLYWQNFANLKVKFSHHPFYPFSLRN